MSIEKYCPSCNKMTMPVISDKCDISYCYWCRATLARHDNVTESHTKEEFPKKIEDHKKLPHAIREIDSSEPCTFSGKGEIPILEVELEGINGLRVLWDGPNNVTIETKDEDGKWSNLPGVQSVKISLSCENPLPIVEISQTILPGIRGKGIWKGEMGKKGLLDNDSSGNS